MIAALWYLQYHSSRNRLITRLKRLRQPKYLIGAIAGGLYFYFYLFRYLMMGRAGASPAAVSFSLSSDQVLLMESLAALLLFVVILLAWLVPNERAALTFTEAEVAFLFPAPVTRRTLIHFKLARSQFRILFSAFFFTLLSRRFGGNAWIHAMAWWLVLSTLNLHFLGSSFIRTMLLDRGISNWFRRLLLFILTGLAVVGIAVWADQTLPDSGHVDATNLKSLASYVGEVFNHGPALYLLYPFRLMVRPYFAQNTPAFFATLAPALLIFLLHYLWVIYADVAFEEASLEASQKLAARVAAIRSGNWSAAAKNQKARRPWFNLAPTGPAFIALFWKNLIGVSRVFSYRFWILLAILVFVAIAVFSTRQNGTGFGLIGLIMLTIVLGYSLLIGPQFLRLDFRYDLPQADILKTFPLLGWQIALGEILAPVAVLAGFQWLLLAPTCALVFCLPGDIHKLLLAVAVSAAVVLPLLDCLLLLIPNAAVLLFPSWFLMSKDGSRGIEATGQRLIFAVGQLLVLLLTLIPGVVVFAAIYFPLKFLLGPVTPVFFAALAASVILALEAAAGVLILGKLFRRFDVTEESTA